MATNILGFPPASAVGPEQLEHFGKRASQKFIHGDMPLARAVAEIVSETSDLNNDQIDRVVEFANIHTYDHMFQNNEDKSFAFDLAASSDVHELLSGQQESIESRQEDQPVTGYSRAPEDYKQEKAAALELSSVFPEPEAEIYAESSPHQPFWNMHARVKGMCEHESRKVASLENATYTASKKLAEQAQRALADGHNFSDVVEVIAQACGGNEKVASAATSAVSYVLQDQYGWKPEALLAGLKAEPHRFPSPGHSLTKTAAQYFEMMKTAALARGQLEIFERQLSLMQKFIGEAF